MYERAHKISPIPAKFNINCTVSDLIFKPENDDASVPCKTRRCMLDLILYTLYSTWTQDTYKNNSLKKIELK